MVLRLTAIIFVVFLVLDRSRSASDAQQDPYETLGIRRTASQEHIKKAYKKLARNWHPDKNKDPEAQEKFIQINQAYEILSGPEKRQQYDTHGHYGPNQHQSRQDPFFDTRGGFGFFFDGPSRHTRTNFISSQAYESHVLPTSYEKPYVLEIISNWCLPCMQMEDLWDRTASEFKNLGVGTGVVNINRSPRLAERLGADRVPQIVGVMKGQVHFFTGRISVKTLRGFVNSLFPRDLVHRVTTKNLDTFLDTQDNKPKLMLFSPKGSPSLLYHLVAFTNQERLSFGFVSTDGSDGKILRRKFKAHANVPTVMIFKEEKSVPEVVVEGAELKNGKLREIVEANKYLILPRLSNRKVFHDLCPEERFRSQRKLCVVLFTEKAKHAKEKTTLRALAHQNAFPSERVHFTYIYEDIQTHVVGAMRDGLPTRTSSNVTILKLAILWNAGNGELRYTWLPGGWHVDDNTAADPATRLKEVLKNIIKGSGKLQYKTQIPAFYNEEIPGTFVRIINKVKDASNYVYYFVTRKDSLSVFTMVVGLLFIGAVSVFLPSQSDDKKHKTKPSHQEYALGFIQLDKSTEKELVSHAAPSQLTVTLLLDSATTDEAASSPLLKAYDDIVGDFSSMQNARLFFKFVWLSIPENLQWCTEVMNVEKFGEIIPGIVLVLNGYKKTVSVFKPTDLTKTQFFNSVDGGMMGFEDSDSEAETQTDAVAEYDWKRRKVLSLSLRRELPRWLEKLTEGMVKKEKREEWPAMEY